MDKMELIKYGSVNIDPNLMNNSYYSTKVVVVGCGGTGGRLIPGLVQHIANHNLVIQSNPINKQYLKHKIDLCLIDGDKVESKNLKRQNFYSFDVGKNKAEIFAKRYSCLAGLDIEYVAEFLKEDQGSSTINYADNMIIFDCTDNVKARRLIETNLYGNHRTVIISCGNEDIFGQVLVSLNRGYRSQGTQRFREYIKPILDLNKAINNPDITFKKSFHILPTLLELYKDFKDSETASCTDIALQDEQSMPINALVAQLAYNAFYNIVAGNKLIYNIVKCNVDNIYDTKFINHPMALRDLYLIAMFGDANPLGIEAVQEAFAAGFNMDSTYMITYIGHDKMVELFDKYGKYFIPFVKIYMEHKYNLSKEQISLFNNRILELERQDANL